MTPDLKTYDAIIINSSGGKDSQTALRQAYEAARHADVLDRVIVVHCDLGRVEWPGVPELTRQQAEHYGLPFEMVRNRNWGDLLERIESRGKWPDAANRYCTSEFKTGQVYQLMTRLVREVRVKRGLAPNGRSDGFQVRILNVLGMRAQESPKRAAMEPFEYDEKASNGRRHVDEWLPIHGWTTDQVWADIRASGVPYHAAYDLGMPRLSCAFCVFSSPAALTVAAQHNPELAQAYADAETRMGHLFRQNLSIADLVGRAKTTTVERVEDWAA